MATLYSYMDGTGNLVKVDEVLIPGVGLGIAVHTTHHKPCLPLEEVPRLINALKEGLHIVPAKERQHGNSTEVGTAKSTHAGSGPVPTPE